MSKLFITGLCLAILAFVSVPGMAAVFTVTKVADTNDGVCDSDCSLREALAAADSAAGEDTIEFDAVLFSTPQIIILSGSELYVQTADFTTVNGPGRDLLTINGNGASRIITIGRESRANISGITFTNGNGVGTQNTGRAGAVYVFGGELNLSDCAITNSTAANGGGITNASSTSPTPAVAGTLTINNCMISGNSSTGSGGGMQNFSTSTTTISNSTFTDNESGGSTGGGGIQANGFINMYNVTFSGNRAPSGSGGGIQSNGSELIMNNVTITNNTSTNNGGGIHRASSVAGLFIRNSIIAGNNGVETSPDVTNIAAGIFGSQGNNLIGNTGTSLGWTAMDITNAPAQLTPLGFFGGESYTHLTMAPSAARDAGNGCVLDASCPTHNPSEPLTTDQRGAARGETNVDIGSTEWNAGFTAEFPSGQVGTPYDFTFIPAVGTYSVSIWQSLPPGLNIDADKSASIVGTPTAGGVYSFGIIVDDGNSILTVPSQITVSGDASTASISGRVLAANGQAVGNTSVEITDGQGFTMRTRTSPFGYFSFTEIPTGTLYTISVSSKVHTFSDVQQQVNGNVTDLVIQATPAP